MTVITSAGTKLFIGTTQEDEGSDVYTEIGEVVDWPEFGRVYELITHNPINNRKTFKFKGSFNDGSLALGIGKDVTDAGQALALIALDSDLDHNFKVEFNDTPLPPSSTPTTMTFKGKIMSYTTNPTNVNSIVSSTLSIEISGAITETAAQAIT